MTATDKRVAACVKFCKGITIKRMEEIGSARQDRIRLIESNNNLARDNRKITAQQKYLKEFLLAVQPGIVEAFLKWKTGKKLPETMKDGRTIAEGLYNIINNISKTIRAWK